MSLVTSRPHALDWPEKRLRQRPARRIMSLLFAAGLTASVMTALAVAPASASTVCDPGSDTCVIAPDTVQTPAGLVTVTVSSGNVVTVQLTPTAQSTLVLGLPFTIPPGPPGVPGYTRQIVVTAGGVVDIDTVVIPPGPPARFTLPNLAIISIHPPNPCLVHTNGTTVVFTPIVPPGPPA